MGVKAIFDEEERDLLNDKLSDHRLHAAEDTGRDHARAPRRADVGEPNRPSLEEATAVRRPAVNPRTRSMRRDISRDPGAENPGIFFDLRRLNPPSPPAPALPTKFAGRKTVSHQKDDDPFHDSEADVFALFNAVNGVMLNGLLDINKLDEFSPEESEALNVPRLREVWLHTSTGCRECEKIISTLIRIRGTLKERME